MAVLEVENTSTVDPNYCPPCAVTLQSTVAHPLPSSTLGSSPKLLATDEKQIAKNTQIYTILHNFF